MNRVLQPQTRQAPPEMELISNDDPITENTLFSKLGYRVAFPEESTGATDVGKGRAIIKESAY